MIHAKLAQYVAGLRMISIRMVSGSQVPSAESEMQVAYKGAVIGRKSGPLDVAQ
jgi:hypothetical protein